MLPGLSIAALVALAATGLATWLGGPALVFALLIGMTLHPLLGKSVAPGTGFAAGALLRFGVALLGARISIDQIMALGVTPLLLVLVSIPLTILVGIALSRALGLSKSLGTLTGGGVAICGSSAAIAIAAVLPQRESTERHLLLTIVGVTALSTLAMLAYPLLARALGLPDVAAGLFLGGSIHNVPQAVAAGFTVSDSAGTTATFVKLLRVAMLAPAVLLVSVTVARSGESTRRGSAFPPFLAGFVALVVINSLGWLPAAIREPLEWLSQACLVVAIAAIGMKASFRELASLGWRPVLLLTLETVFLAGLVLAGTYLLN